jgi:hypothetical protein
MRELSHRDWRALPSPSPLAAAAAVLVFLLALSPLAYFRMFSQFHVHDDEGYVMQSVRGYLSGAPLYDEVFSQYGPAFYLFARVFHGWLGVPVTHDAVRLLTIGCWLAATMLGGAIAFRLTRSLLVSGLCAFLAFGHLTPLINEPGHPQGVLIVVVLCAAWVASGAGTAMTVRRSVACGVLTAMAALVKINVGAYLGLGLLVPLVLASPMSAVIRGATILIAAATPFAILQPHLHAFGGPYAVLVSASVLSLAMAATPPLRGAFPDLRVLAAFCSGVIVTGIAVAAAILIDGTSMTSLARAVVIEPSRLRSIFVVDPGLPPWTATAAVASAAVAAAFMFGRVRASEVARWLTVPVALAGVWVLTAGLTYGVIIAALTPTLWLAAVRPDSREPDAAVFGRTAVASIAAFETLMAYPVGGSQLAFASVLTLTVTVAMLEDVVILATGVRARLLLRVVCVGLALHLVRPHLGLRAIAARYRAGYELRLPGASHLHLPREQVAQLHWLTASVTSSCDRLVTVPGLFSVNIWSGVAPPTHANVGAWQVLLSQDDQRRMWDALDRSPRPCVIVNPVHANFWAGGKPLDPDGHLVERRTAAAADGFSLMIDNERDTNTPIELVAGRQAFSADRPPLPVSTAFFGERESTLRLWFRTSGPGVLLGCQWMPQLYIGLSGALRTGNGAAAPPGTAVTDGAWHHVAVTRDVERETLYLDGRPVATTAGPWIASPASCQIGGGLTSGWRDASVGWMPFTGEIDTVGVTAEAWDGARATADLQATRVRHQEH